MFPQAALTGLHFLHLGHVFTLRDSAFLIKGSFAMVSKIYVNTQHAPNMAFEARLL